MSWATSGGGHLDPEARVDVVAEAADLFVGQVTDPGVGVHVGARADLLGHGVAMPKM